MSRELISPELVRTTLGIKLKEWHRMLEEGRVGPQPIKTYKGPRYRPEEIDAWIEAGKPCQRAWLGEDLVATISAQSAELARLREALEQCLDALDLADRFGSRGQIDDNTQRDGKSVSFYIDNAIESARATLAAKEER